MNIQQATKIAVKQKRGITRKSWGPRSVTILPTNTANGCLLLFSVKSMKSKVTGNQQH